MDNEFNGATLYTGEGTAVHGSTLVPHSVSNGLSGELVLLGLTGRSSDWGRAACVPAAAAKHAARPAAVRASAAAASLIAAATLIALLLAC